MHFRIEEHRDGIEPPERSERDELRTALAALARPRMTGSPGALEVERELRGRFEGLGYQVRDLHFRFSTWPGRFGVPVAGALLLIGVVGATILLLADRAGSALLALLAAAGLIGGLAYLGRAAVARLPWGRLDTANWLVHRPGARPRFLVVAHRDSKSQPVSSFVRAGALVVGGLAWLGLALLAAFGMVAPAWAALALTVAVGALGAAASGVLIRCRAGNDSPGALDNATGLAALLGLARREREHDDVAFLVTDGEEMGLAGACAVCGQIPPVAGVINLDGLDDEGDFHIVEQYGWPRRGLAPHLAAALLSSADALELDAERRSLPIGILVDHIAFVEAGLPAITLMRGTSASLRRVHRPHDSVDRLKGDGVVDAVALVAGALRLLRDGS